MGDSGMSLYYTETTSLSNESISHTTVASFVSVMTENFTYVNVSSTQKAQLLLYDVLIPTIGALSIIMNLAVVISSGLILKKGQQPRSTYLFLGNVAMTDLITSIAVVFGQAYPPSLRNRHICAIQIGMIVSSTLASVYSVGLIAVDRFLYIIHGLQYQRWIYPLRARLLILSTWVIGCVIGFLPLMGWAGDTKNGKICWFILLAPKPLILLTVAIGVLPLLLVVILYAIILYHAIKKIMQLQRANEADAQNKIETDPKGLRIFRGRGNVSDASDVEDNPVGEREEKSLFRRIFTRRPQNNLNNPSKWKAIKVVIFTSGSFVVTWSPYFIACVIYIYCKDPEAAKCKSLKILIASPLAILGFANSLVNPIIYAWWHKGFRTFVTQKFESIRKKRTSRDHSVSHSSKNTSSTTESRKISNTSTGAIKLDKSKVVSKPVGLADSTEHIIREDDAENKSTSKSETTADTKLSTTTLNNDEKSENSNRNSCTSKNHTLTEPSSMENVNLCGNGSTDL